MEEQRKLHILWTTGETDTAMHMVMMYAGNSMRKKWWDEVTVVIWGAAAALAAGSEAVQREMQVAMNAGVKFSACVACAARLGVEQSLAQLGVEIKPWGQPLTEVLQHGGRLLSV